jgi:hypothetical protein
MQLCCHTDVNLLLLLPPPQDRQGLHSGGYQRQSCGLVSDRVVPASSGAMPSIDTVQSGVHVAAASAAAAALAWEGGSLAERQGAAAPGAATEQAVRALA